MMEAIRAVVADGHLQLESPLPWPDGTEVTIVLATTAEEGEMTAEEIAGTLAAMDRSEPLEMTQEELAALEAQRETRKEWEKSHFFERAEQLRQGWK
jgi:hypothetical protein